MSTAEKVVVSPFGVEFDHPRNCDVIVQSIPGCRMRSIIRSDRYVIDAKTGESRIPPSQAAGLATIPRVPGMQLHINPAKCTYTILDPLYEDEELCELLRKRLSESTPFRVGNKLSGVPTTKGTLDVHRMKTLCREVIHMLNIQFVKVVKGVAPELKDVEAMPGHFLLNPGSRIPNQQPTYEKDFDAWCERLVKSGG